MSVTGADDGNTIADQIDDADQRVSLTAYGLAMAGRDAPDDVAAFFVVAAGNAFLRLRAAGNAASGLLAALEPGDRVEVRLVPLVSAAPGSLTEGGRRAGWRGVSVNGGDAVLLVEALEGGGS